MNSEYALDTLKSNLETYLSTKLTEIQIESGSSSVAPTPAEFKLGEHDPNILTMYPSVLVWSPYSRKSRDSTGFQVREIWIRTLVWIVQNDLEDLHRFIARYGDAVSRVIRDESLWESKGFHNPVVEDSNNTDLYKQDTVGYAQGVLVESTIDYILV